MFFIRSLIVIVSLAFFAASSIALTAGNIGRGRTMFNDPNFAGATSGKSCNSCHPGGSGLKQAGRKKVFHIAGKTQKSLAEAINACIEYAINGKAIDPGSVEMQDIVAYIKSL